MTLRGKLWAANSPSRMALIVVGLFSWWALSALAARSRQILESNDRSVQAAQEMSGPASISRPPRCGCRSAATSRPMPNPRPNCVRVGAQRPTAISPSRANSR